MFSAESTPYCDEKKELAGSRARTEAGQSNTKGTKADETQRRRTGKKTQRKQKGQERKQQQKTEKRKRNQKRRAQREQVRRPSKHVFHVLRRTVFMFDVYRFWRKDRDTDNVELLEKKKDENRKSEPI